MPADSNWVDYCIIGIFFISILMGLMRGFIKEVIALVTWIIALAVASSFAGQFAQTFVHSEQTETAVQTASQTLDTGAISTSISFIVLFLVILIIGAIISYLITRLIEIGGISIINRSLGGLFGLMRGLLLNLMIIFIIQLSSLAQQAAWADSYLVKAYQPAISLIYQWIEPGVMGFKTHLSQTLQHIRSTADFSQL